MTRKTQMSFSLQKKKKVSVSETGNIPRKSLEVNVYLLQQEHTGIGKRHASRMLPLQMESRSGTFTATALAAQHSFCKAQPTAFWSYRTLAETCPHDLSIIATQLSIWDAWECNALFVGVCDLQTTERYIIRGFCERPVQQGVEERV